MCMIMDFCVCIWEYVHFGSLLMCVYVIVHVYCECVSIYLCECMCVALCLWM